MSSDSWHAGVPKARLSWHCLYSIWRKWNLTDARAEWRVLQKGGSRLPVLAAGVQAAPGRRLIEAAALTLLGVLLFNILSYLPDIPLGGGYGMDALAVGLFFIPALLGALAAVRRRVSFMVSSMAAAAVPFFVDRAYLLAHPPAALSLGWFVEIINCLVMSYLARNAVDALLSAPFVGDEL